MRRLLSRHQKFQAIGRILEQHPEVFEEKPKALAMKAQYIQQLEAASTLISNLLRPLSTVHRPKQEEQEQYLDATYKMLGMGGLLAQELGNKALEDLLRQYNNRMSHISAYKQYEAGLHIVEELELRVDTVSDFGLSQEKLQEYRDQCTSFGNILTETGDKLELRRERKQEAQRLVNICSSSIRYKIDPYVKFYQNDFPDFYYAYFLVRGVRRKPRLSATEPDKLADLSGTVTDSVTGLPVEGAIVNIIGLDLAVQTDGDGYYLVEELPETSLVAACYMFGYELPEQVSMETHAGESLVVNFTLTPAVALPEAS